MNARAWEFRTGGEERAATNRLRFGSRFGRRARVRGRPTSPIGRSSGFAGGFFHFIISSAVSVRARWKKGQGAAKGKLLSQLSFPVYAGQVVFRAAHQQTTTWSLAIGRRFAHFFVRPVMFCHVLFGTFSRFAWSPLERQDTADGGPLSPLFCLSRPPRWRRMWRHGPAPHGLASGAGRLRRLGALPASPEDSSIS